MAGPFAFTLLCGLLSTTLAETALNPPAVFSLGREVIKESKFQGPWLARLEECMALDLWVVSLSSMLDVAITLKKEEEESSVLQVLCVFGYLMMLFLGFLSFSALQISTAS